MFLHVPKSAGTTLRAVFHRALGDQLLWFRNPDSRRPPEPDHPRHTDDLSKLNSPEAWAGVRMVGGHFPAWKLPLALLERRPLLMAVLREPVARVESLYAYIRREEHHALHHELSQRTLLEALDLPQFRRVVPQGQLRFLRTAQRPWHPSMLAPFPVLIGKHEHLPAFVEAAARRTGLPLELADMSANVSPPGYRDSLKQQAGYAEARALIASLTEDEAEFMRSFDQIYEHEAGDMPVVPQRPSRPAGAVAKPAAKATPAPKGPRPDSRPAARPLARADAPPAADAAGTQADAPTEAQAERRAARREARRGARQAERRRLREQGDEPQGGSSP
ncbi:hypothetical protein KAK06_04595 [Ideonella sp. 4Y11]|uniref:Sulfotransferase family protein n=1 Tax=Ideonella aquatica TaxID=2824119 RepID=A0A941BI49_9BURK|nr:hypothetical protein [Ideonella aquatica]MBQ0958227.1 hypothetical protein [Ideonella aquatica]